MSDHMFCLFDCLVQFVFACFALVMITRVLIHLSSLFLGIIQSATVIITAPGGGSFGSFFARRGASVIYLDKLSKINDSNTTSVRFAGNGANGE